MITQTLEINELKEVLQDAIRDGHRFLIKYTRNGAKRLHAMPEAHRQSLAEDLASIGYTYAPSADSNSQSAWAA